MYSFRNSVQTIKLDWNKIKSHAMLFVCELFKKFCKAEINKYIYCCPAICIVSVCVRNWSLFIQELGGTQIVHVFQKKSTRRFLGYFVPDWRGSIVFNNPNYWFPTIMTNQWIIWSSLYVCTLYYFLYQWYMNSEGTKRILYFCFIFLWTKNRMCPYL